MTYPKEKSERGETKVSPSLERGPKEGPPREALEHDRPNATSKVQKLEKKEKAPRNGVSGRQRTS